LGTDFRIATNLLRNIQVAQLWGEMIMMDQIKMSAICVIRQLEEKVYGETTSTFNYLENLSLDNLHEMRDNLIIDYNETVAT
jgi:hypothetical protein